MQNSRIEWCSHTFNIVWGCIRVSPGCEHCYAETLAHRYGYKVWGPAKTTERRTMSENYWKQPMRWNAAALKAPYGVERPRVFCGSMCDVFEDHPTNARERIRLWETIGECDALDWLLLTKRPENILKMVPTAWAQGYWPEHVWAMTSVENQEQAAKRIPELLKVPARVRGLSCEPLLGPLDIEAYLYPHFAADDSRHYPRKNGVEWVITGGESGHGARPAHPDWFRSLRNQCQAAGVPFFFKQHGEYVHADDCPVDSHERASLFCAGGTEDTVTLYRVGKHAAGRLLDGVEHSEFPR